MFIKNTIEVNSPFQKNHVYILRDKVPAMQLLGDGFTRAGTLDGRENGMILQLKNIGEEKGTHTFCGIAFDKKDGFTTSSAYDIELKDLNIKDFEDITDTADFKTFLHSVEENMERTKPLLKRIDFKNTLLTILILIGAMLLGIAGVVAAIPVLSSDSSFLKTISTLGIIIPVVFGMFFGMGACTRNYDFKIVHKKESIAIEAIYQKNDALLRAFEQKKHLERT